MRGRAVLAGLLGCCGGLVIGLLAAMLLVYLWFDVFHLPPPNDEPKPGLEVLGVSAPLLMGLGAIAGTWVMVRRVRAGRSARGWGALFAVAILFVLGWLGVIIS